VNDDVGRRVGRETNVVVVLAENQRLRIDRIDERRWSGAGAEPLPAPRRGSVEGARQDERPEGAVGCVEEPCAIASLHLVKIRLRAEPARRYRATGCGYKQVGFVT
jgi:hypothetical protein